MQKHGGNIYKIANDLNITPGEVIDYSSNINPLGPSGRVLRIIKRNLINIKNYPDSENNELLEKLAAYNSVRSDQIVLGNGAIELIYGLASILSRKKILVIAPTFSEYAAAFKKYGASIDYFKLKESAEFELNINALKEEIKNKYDLIMLCNPNNPTSTFVDINQVLEIVIAAEKSNSIVMIDESFIEFARGGLSRSIVCTNARYNNLIVLRSMTKFFAIPGLRLGYSIIFNAEIINRFYSMEYPWKINYLAGLAGIASLGDNKYIGKSVQNIEKERNYLYRQLIKINWLKVFKPQANFILLKILNDYSAEDIYKVLLKKKILIRKADDFEFLNDKFFRVAVKKRSSNRCLVKYLAEFC